MKNAPLVRKPVSLARLEVTSALLDGPGTTRELALRTSCHAVWQVRKALTRMVATGEAVKVGSVRVRGVCRPVPVYARRPPPDDTQGAPALDLIAAWYQRPLNIVQGAQGPAM